MSQTPARGRHRAPSAARRRLGRAVLASLTAGAPVAALGIGVAPAAHAETDWDALAKCESGGDWGINTGNGFGGGLQFTDSTWRAFGGSGQPEDAGRAEQIRVAERVKAEQGMNAWPTCSKKTGQTSNAAGSSSKSTAKKSSESSSSGSSSASSSKSKGSTKPTEQPKQKPASSSVAPAGSYTVKSGDTLSSIASTHGVSGGAADIASRNGIANPDVIAVGQQLALR